MDDKLSDASFWTHYANGVSLALIASGAAILEGLRRITSGYGRAETRNLNATAKKFEAEAGSADAKSSAEFERAINDRIARTMDALENQVKHLSELVKSQSAQLTAQSEKMDHMELEIASLRRALDDRTYELHQARNQPSPQQDQMNFNPLNEV